MIDTLPNSVEILVDNPREAAEQLVKKGGVRLNEVRPIAGKTLNLVEFRDVYHFFDTPDTWKRTRDRGVQKRRRDLRIQSRITARQGSVRQTRMNRPGRERSVPATAGRKTFIMPTQATL